MKLNQTFVIAISIWAALLAAHFFGALFFFKEPVLGILLDSFLFFLIYGFLSWGCYFFIRYIDLPRKPPASTIFNLIAAVIVCTLIWYIVGSFAMTRILTSNIEYQDFISSFKFARAFEGIVLFTIMMAIFLVMRYQERIGEAQLEEANLKSLVSESRMEMLNSQINPHFLFNSLNSISAQTLVDPGKAREMLSGLSDYLRYTLEGEDKKLVPFSDELENSLMYMQIEQIRFGKRLEFSSKVQPEAKNFLVPRMILQPLLENIIKHSVEKATEPIKADLKASLNEGSFSLLLENDMAKSTQTDGGRGIGLKNIEERLELSFGKHFSFNADVMEEKFKVYLRIDRKNESPDN